MKLKKGILPIGLMIAAAVLVAVAAGVLVFGEDNTARPFDASCIDAARSAPNPKDGPTISSLNPTSGPTGTSVVISGNKFTGEGKNTVCFGPQNLGQFDSRGDKINFTVPATNIAQNHVYVINPKGTSNSQVFTVPQPSPTPSPSPTPCPKNGIICPPPTPSPSPCPNPAGVCPSPTPELKVDIKANGTDQAVVPPNSDVGLTWTTSSPTISLPTCEASGDWSGSKPPTGQEGTFVSQLRTYIYTLTCRLLTPPGIDLSASDSAYVTVTNTIAQ